MGEGKGWGVRIVSVCTNIKQDPSIIQKDKIHEIRRKTIDKHTTTIKGQALFVNHTALVYQPD